MSEAVAAPDRPKRSSEEGVMRDLVVAELRKLWPEARIIHELPTRYSTNRIDLAAVTRDDIVAVEIKSSRDVADRLEAQLRAFEPITTRLIVALAPKWNPSLPPERTPIMRHGKEVGTRIVPRRSEAQEAIRRADVADLDVWTVSAETGEVQGVDRSAWRWRRAPWPVRLLNILHVAELQTVLARHSASVPRRATHEHLVKALLSVMTTPQVVRAVCHALRARDAFDRASDPPVPNPDAPAQSQGAA